jgi:EAL domain-containing protein (putative c-di-GMP-specific phosphodiesterase class I)
MCQDQQLIKTILASLHDLGVRLAIDDFGSGSSCLNDLRQLPVDMLKIDPVFIHDIGNSKTGEAMVKSIINMAHNLDLKVIAEGVETRQQSEFLTANQCDILQGYFFARPQSEEQMSQYLTEHKT